MTLIRSVKRISFVLTSVFMSLILSQQVVAGPDHKHKAKEHHKKHHGELAHREHGGLKPMMRAFSQLNLTEQQKQSIKALKIAHKEEMKPRYIQAKQIKKQLHQELKQDHVDANQVKKFKTEIMEIETENLLSLTQFKKQAVAVLDDNQKQKLAEMKQKREEKMKQHKKEG
jgi:periplasmic protein CpxP/Spy